MYKSSNYGKLSDKVAEGIPWNKLLVYRCNILYEFKKSIYMLSYKGKEKNFNT